MTSVSLAKKVLLPTFVVGVGSYATARIAEQGFADFLGLHTLRCGVNPLSWLRIHLMGIKPNLAKMGITNPKTINELKRDHSTSTTASPSAMPIPKTDENFFPVFKDTRFCLHRIKQEGWALSIFDFLIIPTLKTRADSLVSNIDFFCSNIDSQPTWKDLRDLFFLILSFPLAIVTPSIKFYVKESNPAPYSMPNITFCYIHKYISPIHSGILGILKEGVLHPKIAASEIRKYPLKSFTGIAQFAISAAIAHYALRHYSSTLSAHKTAAIVGAVFALV